jgi:hypothetical protein
MAADGAGVGGTAPSTVAATNDPGLVCLPRSEVWLRRTRGPAACGCQHIGRTALLNDDPRVEGDRPEHDHPNTGCLLLRVQVDGDCAEPSDSLSITRCALRTWRAYMMASRYVLPISIRTTRPVGRCSTSTLGRSVSTWELLDTSRTETSAVCTKIGPDRNARAKAGKSSGECSDCGYPGGTRSHTFGLAPLMAIPYSRRSADRQRASCRMVRGGGTRTRGAPGVGVVGAEDALAHGEGAFEEWTGGGRVALLAEECTQVVEAVRGPRMGGSVGSLPAGQGRSNSGLATSSSPRTWSSRAWPSRLSAVSGWSSISPRTGRMAFGVVTVLTPAPTVADPPGGATGPARARPGRG